MTDEFSRIEPKNNVAYAAQSVFLTRLVTGVDLASQTAADLAQVFSPEYGTWGDRVFWRQLQRAEDLASYPCRSNCDD